MMEIEQYFKEIVEKVDKEYAIANRARSLHLDPVPQVEISLAKNMAERVMGLISTVAPHIKDSDLVERIKKYEELYGVLDWRVAFKIAEDIARQEVVPFETQREAIEVGIRVGFSYVTVGVVSACLEGFTSLYIKKTRDGKDYFCMNFSGPVRNAGGTAAAVSVLIADYVRKIMGYAPYDATEKEQERTFIEVHDYHERCVNVQYLPSKEELLFLTKHVPIQINGNPTERMEVSTCKNLPRIETNVIRGGFCLIFSSCIPLKAPKLWKQLAKWGKDFQMDHWNFLEEFIAIQKKAKSKRSEKKEEESDEEKKEEKLIPNYNYMTDMVAGRPIISHPLAKGGFRLRYGRSRTSGLSAMCVHPATMHILDHFLAVGTQLKVERPSKAAVFSSCIELEGPVVLLKSGDVIRVETEAQAKSCVKNIKKVLFLGDILTSYGDFFDRAHMLCPPGYCEEWWIQELQQAFPPGDNIEHLVNHNILSKEAAHQLFKKPILTILSADQCIKISQQYNIPFHPRYTYHWNDITLESFCYFLVYFKQATIYHEPHFKIVLPIEKKAKTILEELGVPHLCSFESLIIEKDDAIALYFQLGNGQYDDQKVQNNSTPLSLVNTISCVKIRDKSGTYIGARMGRPEKGKMRKMVGSPHGLFPVGDEGGRLRSFQEALSKGKVTSSFIIYKCKACSKNTVYPLCEQCGDVAERYYNCKTCGHVKECSHNPYLYENRVIDFSHYFNDGLKRLGFTLYPDLIKGVRGTVNKDHYVEHIAKAILRAKHNIHVNKDGTVRYDATELSLTHFKPHEIQVTVAQLKKLGYTHDYEGNELEREDQICELLPQDIVLPGFSHIEEGADSVFFRTALFVDELLQKLYKCEPYYNVKSKEDLLGEFVIGMAPHISAGTIGRIIGFSKNQCMMAHPLFHCAIKRDCDGDEGGMMLLLDAFLNFSQKYLPSSRGATMDAPLVLTSILKPSEVDDMVFNLDICDNYPLGLYEAALEYKMPWDVKIRQVNEQLGKPEEYIGYKFTHENGDFNAGILISSYKTLETMKDKVDGQMNVAVKVRAVDEKDVATLVINKHFMRDTKGNLRKFSQQQFRCVSCNEKYRRPPLCGRCIECHGKIIFTVHEGSVIKYLALSQELAKKYEVSSYLIQSLELTQERIDGVFGKDADRQEQLANWF